MIQIKNLTKIYDKGEASTNALNGINLDINDGELVAIMGTSGSGKTTLLNIMGGMDSATSGEYICDNITVSSLKGIALDHFRRENISFIFQDFALMEKFTVYDNVRLPLACRKMSEKQRRKIVYDSLLKVGIKELSGKYPNKISGGQRQRCAIARAVASGNKILLADEPTGSLDAKTGQEIIDILKELNKSGTTVIIVTHDEKIAAQTNRIIRIEDGRII